MRLIILLFLLSACARYEPTVDLRASGSNAELYHRDLLECRDLVTQMSFAYLERYRRPLMKCMEGRGHSVLDKWD
jgi:hypothetical protein